MPITWHLLTGEYPPDCGGVGDYTAELALRLADARSGQGSRDAVHVWTPVATQHRTDGVIVHRLPDWFGAKTRGTLDAAWRATPGVILLQYVPNALGARGANLPFCRWFSRLRERHTDVRVMFHEPYMYFTWSRPWAPANALAAIQRTMARALLQGARQVYQSTDNWERYLSAVGAVPALQTLPIPSSIPRAAAPARGRSDRVIGHFGTYGDHVATELEALLPALASRLPDVRFCLLGTGGRAFLSRLAERHPQFRQRASASGRLDPPALAAALRACDLLVQPYPDGITTRRTSAMAGLKNAVATVTTAGELTETVWGDTGAVALVPQGNAEAFAAKVDELLYDGDARAELGRRGAEIYEQRFSIERTIEILRG